MNYGMIKKMDVADGPGIRVSLFVSGCSHHCKDCFNQETWDFQYGSHFTEDTVNELLEAMKPDYIEGLTLLGGEPMEPTNRMVLLSLVQKVKQQYPEKSIWCYSGYLCEDLLCWAGITDVQVKKTGDTNTYGQKYQASSPASDHAELRELLMGIDVLVDGEFMADYRNLMLKFRGSENQRLIYLKRTLEEKTIVLL